MNNAKEVVFNITNRTIVRTILWVIFAILAFRFMGRISHGLILIFTSIFLALALNPIVGWMSRHLKIKSRVRATTLAYLMVIAALVVFFSLVTPPLIRQTRTFISDVPEIVNNYKTRDSSVYRFARKYKIDDKISKGAKDFASHYSSFGATALDTGRRIVEAIVSVLVVLVMTFMMLVEGPSWVEAVFRLMPSAKRDHRRQIARKMYRGVTGFVNGQVILAIVAGSFAFIALEIFSHLTDSSVNAAALAGIVSVFGLIPLLGNPISSTIVLLVCLSDSGKLALIMLIYFVVYYFIENHTFQPYIQSKMNDLTPLTVFIAAILGVGFGGLLGAIIAIPIATCVKVLIEDQIDSRGLRSAK